MVLSEYVLYLLVQFSGFLLDLDFLGFVVNICLYLFLMYQELQYLI